MFMFMFLFAMTVFAQSEQTSVAPFTGEYSAFFFADTAKTHVENIGEYLLFRNYGTTSKIYYGYQFAMIWCSEFPNAEVADSIQFSLKISYVTENISAVATILQVQDQNHFVSSGNFIFFSMEKNILQKVVIPFKREVKRITGGYEMNSFLYLNFALAMITADSCEVGLEIQLYSIIGKNADGTEVVYFKPVVATGLEEIMNTIPESYSLQQNYPNPFNPSTTIKFSIPEQGMVSLIVYSTLGQEVARLVNEQLSVGTYEYKFDASDLSSGVYIYSLRAKNFIQTKKMLLVK
ncbi:MAG: T9SS type A sorting domain-containing protein [Candidatus Paceibacterota bacterium]|jgi:hypothetical protein